MSEAQEAFESAVRDAFKEMHGALGYNPRRALNMVNQYGAVDAARRLLYMPGETSQGLETLWEHHRLDLSIEALMLKPEFASLFTNRPLSSVTPLFVQPLYLLTIPTIHRIITIIVKIRYNTAHWRS